MKNQSPAIHQSPHAQTHTKVQSNNIRPLQRKVKARALVTKLPGEGKWSKKQQIRYIQFLAAHFETMSKSELRKTKKIFIKMAKTLRTRVPEQCRSHHQKMMQMHGALEQVIRFYREEVFPLGDDDQVLQKMKNMPRTQEEGMEWLYRLQRKGNVFRFQINSDRVAQY